MGAFTPAKDPCACRSARVAVESRKFEKGAPTGPLRDPVGAEDVLRRAR